MAAEQVMAFFLNQLKHVSNSQNMVLSVSSHADQEERLALMNSAKIAGINCLGLLNDHSAVALGYAYSKFKEISKADGVWRTVCFIDLGLSQFSISIVEFYKDMAKVILVCSDRNLGARDISNTVLLDFAERFKNETKDNLDVLSNPKCV